MFPENDYTKNLIILLPRLLDIFGAHNVRHLSGDKDFVNFEFTDGGKEYRVAVYEAKPLSTGELSKDKSGVETYTS